MGALNDIKSILESNLSTINSTMQFHQQLILNLQKENNELKNTINNLLSELTKKTNNPRTIPTKNTKKESYKDSLQTEVINKFKRNKRRMIKNKILEAIKFSTHLSIPEIKEIIVDQHKYCSKASYYRYIEELKRHDFIHINEENIVKLKPLVEVV